MIIIRKLLKDITSRAAKTFGPQMLPWFMPQCLARKKYAHAKKLRRWNSSNLQIETNEISIIRKCSWDSHQTMSNFLLSTLVYLSLFVFISEGFWHALLGNVEIRVSPSLRYMVRCIRSCCAITCHWESPLYVHQQWYFCVIHTSVGLFSCIYDINNCFQCSQHKGSIELHPTQTVQHCKSDYYSLSVSHRIVVIKRTGWNFVEY